MNVGGLRNDQRAGVCEGADSARPADLAVIAEARRRRLAPREFLAGHDSYWFFDATGGLIKTGPTHTNVMDVQVVLSEPRRRRLWVPTKDRIEARRAEEAAARPPGRRTSKPNRRG